jgi:hypothetical protein
MKHFATTCKIASSLNLKEPRYFNQTVLYEACNTLHKIILFTKHMLVALINDNKHL